jgi:hypothetical protein
MSAAMLGREQGRSKEDKEGGGGDSIRFADKISVAN